jgi:hypothetical protein
LRYGLRIDDSMPRNGDGGRMVCHVIKMGQKFARSWSGIAGDSDGGKGAGGEKEESGEEDRHGGFPSGEKCQGVFCTNDGASSKSRRRE